MSTAPLPAGFTNRAQGDVCYRILQCAGRGMLRLPFLAVSARLLREACGSDQVELRLVERRKLWSAEASDGRDVPRCEVVAGKRTASGRVLPCHDSDTDLERLCEDVIERRVDLSLPCFTLGGAFWTSDTHVSFPVGPPGRERLLDLRNEPYRSLVILPFDLEDEGSGLILLKSRVRNFFMPDQIEWYEYVAGILAIAATQRRVQVALRERVKEATCLHGIARVAARPGVAIDEILQEAALLVPRACLHEEIASAAIEFDGQHFRSPGYTESPHTYSAEVRVSGVPRGTVTLALAREMPELDVGPFLKEELALLDVVAGELALVIEARETEEERAVLEEQLRHADRLATLGQLAAGVAHELNEPLAAILARAQLAAKIPELPERAKADCDKIVAASLHARGVINKLRLFARRERSEKEDTDLNDIVRDGLVLLEEHVSDAGVTLESSLAADLPPVFADAGQLHQVLINLVVNALQATPPGGRVVVRTMREDERVGLDVEDTGSGIAADVLPQIFAPFFTTKDVDQGTGLGLAVVHGIVTAHGGTIEVKTEPGRGSLFRVWLPAAPPPAET